MPYNTRRKSLSLPSLGIQLPNSSRNSHTPPSSARSEQPPSKKVKREHSPLINVTNAYEPTPPLSPPPETGFGHDDIGDEIVAGVVRVLERTGNRPHTVKELASVLAPTINLVENSANPQAIISARLNGYLKRGFSRSSPCILKKELINTHPRRIYFYLTTCHHQPIPKHEADYPSPYRSVVSPALSDAEEDEGLRHRSESPEVDLSAHEFDDGDDINSPAESSLSSTASADFIARERTRSPSTTGNHNQTPMSSPPLEGEEREFEQSAIYIDRWKPALEPKLLAESDGSRRSRDDEYDHEDSASDTYVLGYAEQALTPPPTIPISKADEAKSVLYSWGGELERHLGSPESVELDELDDLLDF